jgi:hypothetical protein
MKTGGILAILFSIVFIVIIIPLALLGILMTSENHFLSQPIPSGEVTIYNVTLEVPEEFEMTKYYEIQEYGANYTFITAHNDSAVLTIKVYNKDITDEYLQEQEYVSKEINGIDGFYIEGMEEDYFVFTYKGKTIVYEAFHEKDSPLFHQIVLK